MPYWISETLAGTPAFLWIFVGLGLPWALALLPRADWQRRVQTAAVALAAGPALLTVWMLALGTLAAAQGAPLLRFDLIFGGTVVMAFIGGVIAWRKWRDERHDGRSPTAAAPPPFAFDERLLIILIAAAMVVRWIVIAYWPFTAYDALWVYGYEGRLYTELGTIPNTIAYYPQFLPLQYSYGQLAYGAINDHAARAGLAFLHLGAILAVYVLAARLFNRRTGVLAAALWALYPHVGEWSRAGDLEILLAMLFTLAAAFFLLAWIGREPRRQYALLAGLMLGVGLWTKPTMGAFVLGMGLLVAIELVSVRFNLRAAWGRLQLALLTLIAAAPLGGVWYLRNLLLGYSPVDFPPAYWHSLAERSGVEFGWLLLALLVYLAYVHFGSLRPRPNWRLTLPGLGLVLLGLAPSILDPHRINLPEWLALAAGVAVLGAALARHARVAWDAELKSQARIVGCGLALALPYFVTWFYAYSYHYRLSFAIVPLLILPTAVILGRSALLKSLTNRRAQANAPARKSPLLKWGYAVLLVGLSLPGVVSAVYDVNAGWDYLWSDALPDDDARYRSGNAALMSVVSGLQVYLDEHPGERLSVVAPSVDRLPFFFPTHDIRVDDAPARLEQLDGVTYFVYGLPETRGAYEAVPQFENQVVSALGRTDIMRRAWGLDDGIFRYDVYELHLENRFVQPEPNGLAADEVVFGNFARYIGYDIGGLELWQGRRVVMHLYWEALAQPPADYSIFVHLRDADDNLIANWDDPVARAENGWYSTLVWDAGEFISDERTILLPDNVTELGAGYRLVIGMYDPVSEQRVPVSVNGQEAGTGYIVDDRISLIAPPQ